jgi:hypothetical protein
MTVCCSEPPIRGDHHCSLTDPGFDFRLNALKVTLAPSANTNKPMIASIGECSSGACTNVKKVPRAKKVRPQMAIPMRCTFVALGDPFHSNASTLTPLTMVSGQTVFRCLLSTSSSRRECWSWRDWSCIKLPSARLPTVKSSLHGTDPCPKREPSIHHARKV